MTAHAGLLYVVIDRVHVFRLPDGAFTRTIGTIGLSSGDGDGEQRLAASGVAVDALSGITVADSRNRCLQRFSLSGQFECGCNAGLLGGPTCWQLHKDYLLVWITEKRVLQLFDCMSLTPLAILGGGDLLPMGICSMAIAGDGSLLVLGDFCYSDEDEAWERPWDGESCITVFSGLP